MKGPRFYYDYSYRMRPRIFPKFFFGMLVGGFVGYVWGRNNNCNQSHQNHYGPFCGSHDRHNCWDNRNSYNPNHQQAFNNQTYPTQYTPYPQNGQPQHPQILQQPSHPVVNNNPVNMNHTEENKPTNQN
ncbi:predicted protein [Naegleria gruberi]|uniref:Predicted protein n=1 Tax=Naegleria gruberi TaxID=5762 RepID=D2W3D1_NAEGR|nr:uncharacterized protein NAEGRDRAFT_75903 [Naegleria gruberi]EFC36395.1 predicted protein [Naegleria gruberi]|eukprot:XP_002669139.1 predicted protein [Naegleria gruberi strain NEG-M]